MGGRGSKPSPHRRAGIFVYLFGNHVLGGGRSSLLILQAFASRETYLLTNRPNLAEFFSVPSNRLIGVPADLTLAGFRQRSLRSKFSLAIGVLKYQFQIFQQLRSRKIEILQVDFEAWWIVAPLCAAFGIRIVQYVRGTPGRNPLRLVLTLALSRHTIFISSAIREYCLQQMLGWLAARLRSRTSVVHNGVDFSLLSGEHAHETVEDQAAVTVGIIGTVCERKGQLPFLKKIAPMVLNRVPKVHFKIVGDGDSTEYLDDCRRAAHVAGIAEHVQFVPQTNRIEQIFRGIDILAHPAYSEGLARVVIEAQAFRKPAVARQILGMDEALIDGRSGFLASNDHEFASKLIMLSTDSALRKVMGAYGHEHVANHFDALANANAIGDLYDRL